MWVCWKGFVISCKHVRPGLQALAADVVGVLEKLVETHGVQRFVISWKHVDVVGVLWESNKKL